MDRKPRGEARPGDPFAEQFDEEEIVLDSFGASDDMFWRGRTRVENRRDPGFAGMVQAALDSAPEPDVTIAGRDLDETRKVLDATIRSGCEDDRANSYQPHVSVLSMGAPETELSFETDELMPSMERPSLRLADFSEPTPLVAVPLLPPSQEPTSAPAAFDPVFPDALDESATAWQASLARLSAESDAFSGLQPSGMEEAAVLVIEDDVPAPNSSKAQVRREEYRHLFSRLRSG
jgi:hypothetical protein